MLLDKSRDVKYFRLLIDDGSDPLRYLPFTLIAATLPPMQVTPLQVHAVLAEQSHSGKIVFIFVDLIIPQSPVTSIGILTGADVGRIGKLVGLLDGFTDGFVDGLVDGLVDGFAVGFCCPEAKYKSHKKRTINIFILGDLYEFTKTVMSNEFSFVIIHKRWSSALDIINYARRIMYLGNDDDERK